VLPLIRDSALWTMGSDSADGDWETAWKRRIDQQPGHSKGSGAEELGFVPNLIATLILRHIDQQPGHSKGSGAAALPLRGACSTRDCHTLQTPVSLRQRNAV